MSKELYLRAAAFYDRSVTGQYDDEAAYALRNHHDLVEALKAATDVLEELRRGHGVEVGSACYPALNLCREVLERLANA